MRRLKRVPQRTCVACRQVRPKGELVRVVRSVEGDVLVDPSGKAPGRGAYVCRSERCAEQAVKQKKLARALGAAVGSELLDRIAEVLR